jgi:carbon storage regulator
VLILSRKVNQSILIGKDIRISVIAGGRQTVRFGIEAPPAVDILREELDKGADEARLRQRGGGR